jgi:hypothetical protein
MRLNFIFSKAGLPNFRFRLMLAGFHWLAGLFLMSFGALAHAARPMVTDDARIVDPQACQVETWAKRIPGGHEFWALPACNLGGNLEVTLGGARLNDTVGGTGVTVLQAKRIFKPLQADTWGLGLATGVQRRKSGASSPNSNDFYAYVPVTWSFRNDTWFVHLNLGIAHEQALGRTHKTWGIASEAQINERSWLITEVFGQSAPSTQFVQMGLRYWIIPNRVQVDTTYGQRLSTGPTDRSISVGLRLLTPALW